METVTCMSLEEMERSISIAEEEIVQQSIYIYLGTKTTSMMSLLINSH